jgi:tRNA-specific 2-thiouridylase
LKKKVIVGLSGGIDSSMTAYLLQKDGYEVEGIYMKLHETVRGYHEKNLEHIDKVAKFLDIKYHILDLTDEFKDEVYDYFVNSYIDGLTPNPCVKCNDKIKFGKLYEKAMSLGGDYLSTGHYAKSDGEFIYKADDLSKDQSYFLGQVKQEVLPKLIFPMSKYTKEYIKAEAMKIPVMVEIASKKESQEICFVDTVYTDILKKHTNIDKEGKTLDMDGNVVGHHKGYMHYTVGKRRGFYVHGAHEPHFVLSQDKKNNTITVGKKADLAINEVLCDKLNMFISDSSFTCEVKLRFRSQVVTCDVNIENNLCQIILKEPVYGVATGQVAVFYDGDKVIGSGYIIQTNFNKNILEEN